MRESPPIPIVIPSPGPPEGHGVCGSCAPPCYALQDRLPMLYCGRWAMMVFRSWRVLQIFILHYFACVLFCVCFCCSGLFYPTIESSARMGSSVSQSQGVFLCAPFGSAGCASVLVCWTGMDITCPYLFPIFKFAVSWTSIVFEFWATKLCFALFTLSCLPTVHLC